MKKTANSLQPILNFDIISKILNIRMQMKKDDRYKKQFDEFIYNFKFAINQYKYDMITDKYGHEQFEDLSVKQIDKCLDEYEIHEVGYSNNDLLSSIEDDLQINYLNDYI
jgi:hypothetical protein